MRYILIGAVLAFAVPAAANATVTVFSGQDDGAAVGGTFTNSDAAASNFFAAALPYSPLLTTGFETLPVGYSASYSLPAASVAITGTNFGAGVSGISNTTLGNLYGFDVGNGAGKWLGFPTGDATFTFAGSTHAFGFYSTGVQSVFGTTFQVSFTDGSSQLLNVPVNVNGGVNFFGLVDTKAFSKITISRPGNDAWGIDNVSYGFPAASPTPEPASWALMLGGFGMLGTAMRRRKATPLAA